MSKKFKNFKEFFKKATGFNPYPYQVQLAKSDIPSALNIPTGAGKTETAILSLWLWRRLNGMDTMPRKLVYCLPMRTLAEQTQVRACKWLNNLGLDIKVELLMGGMDTKIQEIHPDKEYVIIGTQDMLVSGALNRAYGNSPSTWPIIFGLLNNDSMWIMDEIQLMENALPTSIQLDAFRNMFSTCGNHKTVWMSATIDKDWLKTVDSDPNSLQIYNLENTGIDDSLKIRNEANKILHRLDMIVKKDYTKKDAEQILKLHVEGTLTIIIVNTVQRARTLFKIIDKMQKNSLLIHSRFRPKERSYLNEKIRELKENEDMIIVATQVLEAGVDVSARTIITEIAPWGSMVQRFGRCNRYGKLDRADIYWIDVNEKLYAPYDDSEIAESRDMLSGKNNASVSPAKLGSVSHLNMFDAVLRRSDIVSLFDNAPDLSGSHTDVSRFVRTMKNSLDINVFWRDLQDGKTELQPERDEICSVPINDLADFLNKRDRRGHKWDYIDGKWEKISHTELFPGQTIMLECAASGYSAKYGWDPDETKCVESIGTASQEPEIYDGDKSSQLGVAVTLDDHTKHVMQELTHYLDNIQHLNDEIRQVLLTAAKYHDIGKVHRIFQNSMQRGMKDVDQIHENIWAKSQTITRHRVPGFRHEAVGALAYMQHHDDKTTDLTAYLIMSHHGKVRLSLRNYSKKIRDGYLLGININGDKLPEFNGKAVSIPETKLDTSIANIGRDAMGKRSWTERVIMLRDKYGPFQLAYLEALLRRADWLASSKEGNREYV